MASKLEVNADASPPPLERLCQKFCEHSARPMVAVEGPNYLLIYLNPAFARLIGRDRSDLVGRPFAEILPDGDCDACVSLLDRVGRTGSPASLDDQAHRETEANPVFWSYSAWPIREEDDRSAGIMIEVSDSTGAALFSQQAVAMNEALMIAATQQHKLAEEARSLSERLQAEVQSRDRFLAMLSHELRNPLAAIQNAVKLAVNSGTREDLEWSRDVTVRQTKNFARLIDDLLDVSRVSHGKIQLRKEIVDTQLILKHAVEAVRPLIEERKHELQLSFPNLKLEADPTRLEQILVNLLTNAAKYTPPGGRIELTVGVDEDEVVFRVSDNGVGIEPELINRIFDLFIQADRSLARSEGGLGLGLTLVQTLAELHGGTITAKSEGLDRGSEFVLRIPRGSVPATQGLSPGSDHAETVSPRSVRVLVVDDNADAAEGVSKLLERSGHEVRVAHNGEEALDVARQYQPEVMLLDIGLPTIDGYELAAALRNEECNKDSVLIAVSGYGEAHARQRAKESGFNHYVVKPVDVDTILALIRSHGSSL